ncbi:MAG: UDP-N-acetylmuramoyl-tripeptide--D-alanyl-D-alanine ligase [Pseudomonadota bacterium]
MTEPLWTSDEIGAVTGGRMSGVFEANGVSIDTRTLEAGDLFVALKDARDGHDFVPAAFRDGAAAALVEREVEGATGPLVIVDDALEALGKLAAASRARTSAKVIGVTGSVGKTGVKEMLRAALSPSGPTHAAEKSFNNHWGVPLTLARMPRGAAFAAVEMGMNHAGEIGPLSRLGKPDVAIITTIAPVHMASFERVEQIADAKAEIFEGLAPGGVAVLNLDNAYFEQLAEKARAANAKIVTFGEADGADARIDSVRVASAATVVKGELHGRPLVFKIGAPGAHLAMNAMAALAAVDAAGGDLAKATLALGQWRTPEGRGSRWRIALGEAGIDGEITLIDESYNANPTSARAALAVLGAAPTTDNVGRIDRGRRVAFIGDMLELGPREMEMHAELASAPELKDIDTVHTCGTLTLSLHASLPNEKKGKHYPSSAEMAAEAGRRLDAGDVAMVKGSLGSKMAVVVDAIRRMGTAQRDNGREGGA